MFSQLAVGCDLAAKDRKQRRTFERTLDLENIVPRHRGGILGVVVVERPDAREGMHDLVRRRTKISADDAEQVTDLALVNRYILCSPVIGDIGGTNQRKILLIGIDEDDAP